MTLFFRSAQVRLTLTTAFALTLLAACGGGGGSSGGPVLGSFASLSQHGNTISANTLTVARTAAGTSDAASAAGAGAVTQSSNADMTSMATTDIADATVMIPETGARSYRLDTAADTTFLDSGADAEPDTAIRLGRLYSTTESPASYQEVVLLHDGANRTAMLAHDRTVLEDGTAASDYFVWGLWVDAPAEGEVAMFEYGAFAEGTTPSAQMDLIHQNLIGEATYNGHAVGAALVSDETTNPFVADVSLTADFGIGAALGSIGGSVNNFRYQNGNGPVSSVVLESTNIGAVAMSSGFFTGDTSAMMVDEMMAETPVAMSAGNWGGQFYGDLDAVSDANIVMNTPGSVAGTFGVQVPDGFALLGAFKADHTGSALTWQPAAFAASPMFVMASNGTDDSANHARLTELKNITTATGAEFRFSTPVTATSVPLLGLAAGCNSSTSCTYELGSTIQSLTFSAQETDFFFTGPLDFRTDNTTNEVTEDSMTAGIGGNTTLVQARLEGTALPDNVATEFDSFGGWLEDMAFAAVRIEAGTETYFNGYTIGVPSGSTPAETGSALWRGTAVASVKADDTFIQGEAEISVDFANTNVDATFDNWHNTQGMAMTSITAVTIEDAPFTTGGFEIAGVAGGDPVPEKIYGRFYGTGHERVGGVFDTSALNGAFGAMRQ
ncbi:MAG: transferrin-binding protein-like solute binding protein [Parvularculales bacterium]